MRITMVFAIMVLLFAGCAVQPPGEAIVFETIDSGDTASEFPEPEEQVIDSVEEWERLWTRIQGSTAPLESLPTIDFSRYMVLAVFAGEQQTGGYEMRIIQIEKVSDALIVQTRLTEPGSGAALIQIHTYPYHIVEIDRTELPIRFEEAP